MKIGIMGSGQLGWMMILEGRRLGNTYYVLDGKKGPAALVSDGFFQLDSYRRFVDRCDVVTYEFEHVDEKALNYAAKSGKMRPGLEPVSLKRERVLEREYLRDNGFPVADFDIASNASEAIRLASRFESAVIKASHGGYDGKGQFFVDRKGLPGLSIGITDRFVVEERIDFDAEASIIASRSSDGTFTAHTPSFNMNRSGMLFYNTAPFGDFGMRRIAADLMNRLDYVGVMGIEFFIRDGSAIINEMAPRVHNTGHHTLIGSSISQFEQHIRAVSGLPVHDPVLFSPSGVLNIIGRDLDERLKRDILAVPGTAIFWYGKEGITRRRKVGHVNVTAESLESLRKKTSELVAIVYNERPDDYL